MKNKLRVWWIPQVGATGEPFYVPVKTVEEGKMIMDVLGTYDAFQLQNNIKPDYCNCGGLEMFDPETGEWEDWWFETEDDYFEDVDEYIMSTENAEEIVTFTEELNKQIDWEEISYKRGE